MDSPLRITLYDKNLVRTGWIEDFDSHRVIPRHLALGTSEIVVPTDYRLIPELIADGARAVVELDTDDGVEQVMSGKIVNWDVQGPSKTGLTTFYIDDDTRVLWNLLGYPTPGNYTPDATGGLSQPNKSDDRTGPAETVVKGYLAANLVRWAGRSLPYTVVPSQGRGATIQASARMVPLAEPLLPLLEGSGVGVSVWQGPAGLVVDCYATRTFPLELSEDAGTVDTWKVSKTGYTATAAIIGGPNEGTSREFKLVVDQVREGRYRDVIETLVDASDQEIAAKILGKGRDALAAAGDRYGCDITLTESSIFRYGGTDGLHVGDVVPATFPGGLPPLTDVVREADLSFTRDDGYQAKFSVGEDASDPDQLHADLLIQVIQAIHEIRAK